MEKLQVYVVEFSFIKCSKKKTIDFQIVVKLLFVNYNSILSSNVSNVNHIKHLRINLIQFCTYLQLNWLTELTEIGCVNKKIYTTNENIT